MFDRLKQVLVGSFVGAIALGYLLAEAILYFVSVFTSPVAMWTTQSQFRGLVPGFNLSPMRSAATPAISSVMLLLIWYFLLRWLYFTPVKKQESPQATS